MGKKRKENKSLSHQQLNRKQRRNDAKKWLAAYSGGANEIIDDYRKRYHLDRIPAVSDLVKIEASRHPVYGEVVKEAAIEYEAHCERKRQRYLAKKRTIEYDYDANSDGTFQFIAGYTEGGAPYGITWMEAEALR